MVWLSDPTLSVVDEALAAASAAPPPPVSFVEPDYGTDWAAFDAGALSMSPPYIYEDGSFSAGGGDVYGAGLSNPWEAFSDWGSADAGMLGAYERPYVYEDGSFSDGGSVYGAGLQNPWETPWYGDPGQAMASGIDTYADPFGAATDAAYFDASARPYVFEDGSLSSGGTVAGAGLLNPWDSGGATDAAYFEAQPEWLGPDFGAATDRAYFEGPSDDMRLGDWIYKYADWGPQTDRAYFQSTLMPENPQDAAQQFLYDPPKIDPNNIDTGGWGWLGPVGRALDDYVLKPLDYVAELGADATPGVLDGMFGPWADAYRGLERLENRLNIPFLNPPDLPSSDESRRNVLGDLANYSQTVEDFRSRPITEQLIAGTIYDPTTLLPGIGYGDDILQGVRSARGSVDDLLERARPYADDLLRNLDDELGAVQIGRTTPLKAGDVVRDAAGQEFTVAKNFEGTINGWVTVVDDTTEKGTRRIKRGMLDNSPVESVADDSLDTLYSQFEINQPGWQRILDPEVIDDDTWQGALDYTSTDYRNVQDYLRGVRRGEATVTRREVGGIIDSLDNLFAEAPALERPILVYRAELVDDPASLIGASRLEKGYLSTSTGHARPEYLDAERAGGRYTGKPVTLDIYVDRGTTALPLGKLLSQSGDGEVLFDYGTNLRFGTGEQDSSGIWTIRAAIGDSPEADAWLKGAEPSVAPTSSISPTVQRVQRGEMDDYTAAYLEQYERGAPGVEQGLTRPDGSGELVYRGSDGTPQGVVAYSPNAITDIAVSPGARRQGVATTLLDELRNWKGITEFKGPFTAEGEALARARGQLTDVPIPIRPTPAPAPPPRVPPTPPTATGPIDIDDARNKLVDALRRESNIRRVGTADREISIGRSAQAKGIRDRLAEGRAMGLKGGELADYARGGMKTGPLRKTVAPALDLSPAEKEALIQEVLDQFEGGDFDVMTAAKAVQKMINGEGAQPREIRMLRDFYGDEVADIVASRPKVSPVVEARREAAEMARNNAVAARQYDKALRAAEEAAQRANRLVAQAQETADRAVIRQRWKAIARQNDAEEIRQMLANPFLTAEEREIARKQVTIEAGRAQRAAGRATEAIWKALEKANPDAETLRRKALDIIKKKVDDPELAKELDRTVALWLDQTRPLLDAIGEQRLQFLKARIADITGDVGDSYLTALLHRREFLRSGLEQQGLDPDIAKKVAKTLMESELQRRYKAQGGVPQRLLDMLDETKADLTSRAYKIASGAAEYTQMAKNTQFGIGDFAVVGQQGLKAVQTSWPQMMAGLANRILNTMHLGIDTRLIPDNEIARKVQYTLDGLAPPGARTGISDYSREGTILSAIPGPTRWIDQKAVVPAADWLNKVQFDLILGNLRSLNYEGNLVLAHLARQDITDPKVRATAAGFANAATSFSPRALDATRAEVEKAVLLSASMRRAQTGVIARVARGLTVGTPTERMLAATSIAAWAGSVLVAGKLVNDYFGIGEFEWDPSKPGFGRITTRFTNGKGQHVVIDLFPQEQVAKAIARSVRALGEGDPALAAKAWGDLGVMSLSPAARPVLGGSAGVGYEPGRGVRYGDLNDGMGLKGRVLNSLPIPPFFESLATEGLPLGARPFEAAGFNTYVESEFTSFDRKVEDAYGKPYRELEPYQKKEADERFGKPQSTVPEIREQQTIAAEVRDRNIREQQQSDQWLEAGQKTDGTPYTAEQWRNDRKVRNEILSRELDIIYRDMPVKADKDKTPLDRYYDAIQAARTPEGAPDWDKVDAYLAGLPQADRDYIARNTGLNDTPLERQYREDVKRIADSGYFDLTEGKREFREQNPEIAELVRRWGYSAASVRAEDITKQFAAEQAASDEMLANRQLSPKQWIDDYHERLAELRGHKDEIYAGFKEDGEPTDALDRWFKQMDALQTPDGKPDWDAIDRWVAQQPASDQAQIDAYTGTALTPKVAEYRADMKAIGDTGYWDMRDQTWGAITKSVPGLAKFETMDDWKESIVAQIEPQLVKAGVPPALARLQAEQYTDDIQLVSDINRVYKEAFLYPWVIKNPALALSLIEWGYYTPDETMKEFLVKWGQYNR